MLAQRQRQRLRIKPAVAQRFFVTGISLSENITCLLGVSGCAGYTLCGCSDAAKHRRTPARHWAMVGLITPGDTRYEFVSMEADIVRASFTMDTMSLTHTAASLCMIYRQSVAA